MSLWTLIFVIVVVGVVLYLVNTLVPMDGKVKQLLNAVVIIVLALWVLSLVVPLPDIRIGR